MPWTQEEKNKVFEFAATKSKIISTEWKQLANIMDRSQTSIYNYWMKNQFVWNDQRRGMWSLLEDRMLQEAVDRVGSVDFKAVAQYVPGRSAIQCEDRLQAMRKRTRYVKTGERWTREEKGFLEKGLFFFLIYTKASKSLAMIGKV